MASGHLGEIWEISEDRAEGLDIIDAVKEGYYSTGYIDVTNLDKPDEILKDARIYFKGSSPEPFTTDTPGNKELEFWFSNGNTEYLSDYTAEMHDGCYTLRPILTETLAYACNKPLEEIETLVKKHSSLFEDKSEQEKSDNIADFYKLILNKE